MRAEGVCTALTFSMENESFLSSLSELTDGYDNNLYLRESKNFPMHPTIMLVSHSPSLYVPFDQHTVSIQTIPLLCALLAPTFPLKRADSFVVGSFSGTIGIVILFCGLCKLYNKRVW